MRQPRSVTLLYGAVALALLLVIATVALVLTPPSPPSVAEFAPRAEERIDEATDVQSSRFGSGAGSCGAGQLCDGVDAATNPLSSRAAPAKKPDVVKARVRRCVGDPPRQTEDPQSPPCVNYFEGDNGGATSRGVTRDEIRVVYPYPGELDPPTLAFLEHFNRRYEFYGRKIRLIRLDTPANRNEPAVQRAMAEKIATELDAFAAIEIWAEDGQTSYRDELSRRGVLSVGGETPGLTTEHFISHGPFMWSYVPPLDVKERNLAEMACNSLAGRPARHGGPEVALSTRVFAALRPKTAGRPPAVEALRDGLARCREELLVREYDPGDPGLALAELRAAGVTTVIPVEADEYDLYKAARDQNYTPEWLAMPGRGLEYEDYSQSPSYSPYLFGLVSRNKLLQSADDPYFWAIRDGDSGFQPGPLGNYESSYSEFYRHLLPLASGIQMAGPTLSARSFERGLVSARFPNPLAGAEPYWQASVGFGPGDHSMVDDFALFWWSPTQEKVRGSANGDQNGSYCYIDRGARWSAGRWPSGELPFFDRTKPCR